jgi:hypothetical protein
LENENRESKDIDGNKLFAMSQKESEERWKEYLKTVNPYKKNS